MSLKFRQPVVSSNLEMWDTSIFFLQCWGEEVFFVGNIKVDPWSSDAQMIKINV